MSDFELDRESIIETRDYPVAITRFENRAEQRRLTDSNKIIGFKIKTPHLTYAKLATYISFFNSKSGALTAFTFTNPMDQIEYTVRFVPESFRTTYETGVYKCSFEFEVIP